jgi:hypothetical protein
VQIQVCSNHGPRGSGGATIGENIFTCVYIGKIFFSRTTKLGKFKVIWQLADIVQIQVCSNYGLWGSGGATIRETIFTCVYVGKIFINLLRKNY